MDDLEHKLKERNLTQAGPGLDARMDDLFFDAAANADTRRRFRVGPWSLVTARTSPELKKPKALTSIVSSMLTKPKMVSLPSKVNKSSSSKKRKWSFPWPP